MNQARTVMMAVVLTLGAGVAGFWLMRIGGGGGSGEDRVETAPTGEAGPAAVDDEGLLQLARHLGSADEPTRKAAEALLARVTYRNRAWLLREAEDAMDPEVKGKLQARVEAIDEALATKLPPISLHVERATLRDVVAALNEEMGTNLAMWEAIGDPALPAVYTLDVKGMPFWEVIAALNQQRPFEITAETIPDVPGGGVGYKLRVGASAVGMESHAISGPLFFYAQTRDGGYGMRTKETNDFRVDWVMLCDPRLPVVDLEYAATMGADSNGNKLDKQTRSRPGNTQLAVSGQRETASGPRPENGGKTISSIKAKVRYITAVPAETLEVPEIESKAGWEATVAGVTVKMPKLDRHPSDGYGSMDFAFEVSPEEKRPLVTLALYTNDNWVAYSCNGRLWNPGPINGTAWLVKPTFNGRLEVAVAKRVYEYAAELEIKDVPVAEKGAVK